MLVERLPRVIWWRQLDVTDLRTVLRKQLEVKRPTSLGGTVDLDSRSALYKGTMLRQDLRLRVAKPKLGVHDCLIVGKGR